MKDFSQARLYFEKELKSSLIEAEKKHASLKKLNPIYVVGMSVFVISIFMDNILLAFVSFGVVALLMFLNREKYAEARSEHKEVLVGPLMRYIDENIKYIPNGEIDKYVLENSLLFKDAIRYESENLMRYSLGKERVTLAFVTAYMESQSSGEDDVGEEMSSSRLFATVKSARKIEGAVCIFPDFAQKHLGFVGEGIQSSKYGKLQKVKLDDPRFEKEFVVYASEQVTANYILTHTIMEVLTKISKEDRKKLSISFVGDKIYVGLTMNYGFFLHDISRKLSDFTPVSHSLKGFYTVVDILEDIYQHHDI
ncbi:MAG: DUF3137 domain-containing protein [Campylobacterota bacterium]|nr:DUF3137 domain-containing protein [Campylobacterota bacterium]